MRNKILFLFLAHILAASQLQAASIYFAQVADGGGYVTAFTLCNPTANSVSGTLKFFTQNGSPRIVSMEGVSATQFFVTVPARGSKRLTTSGDAKDVSSGWAYFESDGTIQGVATFEMRNGSALATLAGVLGSQPLRRFMVPIEVTALMNTGFAVANVSTANPVIVQLTLVGEDGASVSSTMMTTLNPLGPGSQIADFVTSAFPSAGPGFKGNLIAEVVGNGSVAATGLTVKEGMLSALPVFESVAADQPSPSCTYSISPTSRSHGAGTEIGSFSVSATLGCPWQTASNVNWISITAGTSGSGNGTVSYSVAAATGSASRSGTISVTGTNSTNAFNVTQAGQSPAPVARVTVTPSAVSLVVGGTQVLAATTIDANGNTLSGRTIDWTTSNQAIVSGVVSGNTATITGVSVGSATITATSEGKSGTASVAVTSSGGSGGLTCVSIAGGLIYANDGQYLGSMTNRYSSDSILNQYGSYGSPYSATSIFNQYGQYGSPYATYSAYNPYTTTPPVLYVKGTAVAYITKNTTLTPRIDPDALLTCSY